MADAERDLLLRTLRMQREHVLEAIDGVADEALRRPVLPSGWSCLGLIRHLTLDVERFWFRAVVAGEQVELETDAGAWQVEAGVAAWSVLDDYRAVCRKSDEVIIAAPALTADPVWWPVEVFAGLPRRDLRGTVLHVITETACHAGHLDAARELLDGHQHLVLTWRLRLQLGRTVRNREVGGRPGRLTSPSWLIGRSQPRSPRRPRPTRRLAGRPRASRPRNAAP